VNTIISFVCFCLLAVLVGCSREAKGPAQPPPASELPASPRGVAQAGEAAAPAIPDSGDTNAILQQMTLALRDYVIHTRTVPKNFDEFAAKSQGSFPQPPAGQKYAIEGQKVVLVKR
jgi:hypothetical protein